MSRKVIELTTTPAQGYRKLAAAVLEKAIEDADRPHNTDKNNMATIQADAQVFLTQKGKMYLLYTDLAGLECEIPRGGKHAAKR
jgi:hypothetical protein